MTKSEAKAIDVLLQSVTDKLLNVIKQLDSTTPPYKELVAAKNEVTLVRAMALEELR